MRSMLARGASSRGGAGVSDGSGRATPPAVATTAIATTAARRMALWYRVVPGLARGGFRRGLGPRLGLRRGFWRCRFRRRSCLRRELVVVERLDLRPQDREVDPRRHGEPEPDREQERLPDHDPAHPTA